MSEFWLVTGAAAPIIALANLVAADEGMTSFYTFRKTRKDTRLHEGEKNTVNKGFTLALLIVVLVRGKGMACASFCTPLEQLCCLRPWPRLRQLRGR
jgi:hypothetical protein